MKQYVQGGVIKWVQLMGEGMGFRRGAEDQRVGDDEWNMEGWTR